MFISLRQLVVFFETYPYIIYAKNYLEYKFQKFKLD